MASTSISSHHCQIFLLRNIGCPKSSVDVCHPLGLLVQRSCVHTCSREFFCLHVHKDMASEARKFILKFWPNIHCGKITSHHNNRDAQVLITAQSFRVYCFVRCQYFVCFLCVCHGTEKLLKGARFSCPHFSLVCIVFAAFIKVLSVECTNVKRTTNKNGESNLCGFEYLDRGMTPKGGPYQL